MQPFRAVALAAFLLLATGLSVRAEPTPGHTALWRLEMAKTAAQGLEEAWQAGDLDRFAQEARRERRHRFRVVLHLALDAADAEARRAILEAFADALGSEAPRGPLRCARAWATADAATVAAERALHARLCELGPAWKALLRLDPDDLLARLSVGSDAPAHSVAGPLLAALRLQALAELGRLDEALAEAGALAEQASEQQWDALAAQVAANRGWLLRRLGHRLEAAEAYREAADVAHRIGDAARETSALQYAMILYLHAGRLSDRYEMQLRHSALAHGPPTGRMEGELWLAHCELALGAPSRAAGRVEAVLEAAERIGSEALAREARVLLLDARSRQGRFFEALALADVMDARPATAALRRARERMAVAALRATLGAGDEAAASCEAVLADLPTEGTSVMTGWGGVLLQAAQLLGDIGRPGEARALLARAAALFERHQQAGRLLGVTHELARLALEEGDVDRAEAHAAVVARLADAGTSRDRVGLHALLGRIALASDRPAAALEAYAKALTATQDGEEPHPLNDAHLLAGHGRAARALGRTAEAIASFEAATDLLVLVATGLGDHYGLGIRSSVHQVAMEGFACAARRVLEEDDPRALAKAWYFREAGQALLLAEAVLGTDAAARENVRASDRVREETALRTLTSAQTRLVLLGGGEASEAEIRRATADLEDAHRAHQEVADRVDRAARAAGGWERARPLSLARFQGTLSADTAAIAYVAGEDRLFGILVRPARAKLVDLGSLAEIERDVAAWRTLARTPGSPTTFLGARLYDRVLGPFAAALEDVRRLRILPDGPLAHLPISALVAAQTEAGEPTEYALDRYATSYVPTGAMQQALESAVASRGVGEGLLALGDPTYAAEARAEAAAPLLSHRRASPLFASLKGTRAEVEAIALRYPEDARTLLLGDAATVDAWRGAVAARAGTPLRAIHLACHGVVDPDRPRLSGLVFAGGGILSVEQIHRLHVPSDLVVLSACDTATGPYHRGEGVMGLTRGFFQSGVPRVVVTSWSVSDEATGVLMAEFHRRWATGATDAAMALRDARLALRRSKGPRAHPYYWGPFVYWGP